MTKLTAALLIIPLSWPESFKSYFFMWCKTILKINQTAQRETQPKITKIFFVQNRS